MIPVALLADNRLHAALRDDILLADIAGIKPQILPFVFLLYKRLDDIGVVDAGICGSVLLNKFRLLVGLHVVFVAVVPLAALLRPSGIGVLVGTLEEAEDKAQRRRGEQTSEVDETRRGSSMVLPRGFQTQHLCLEQVAWLKNFCRLYLSVGNNPDYQYAYHIFRKQLSDGKHRKELFKLTMSHFMAKAAWLNF